MPHCLFLAVLWLFASSIEQPQPCHGWPWENFCAQFGSRGRAEATDEAAGERFVDHVEKVNNDCLTGHRQFFLFGLTIVGRLGAMMVTATTAGPQAGVEHAEERICAWC